MPLTDKEIKALQPREKQFKASDGAGLYLLVRPNGSKLWQMKYKFDGREKTLSFGKYPSVSLKDAREARDDAKKKLRDNIDPNAEKRQEKKQAASDAQTFANVAAEMVAANEKKWSEGHYTRVTKILENELCPEIGSTHIASVTASDLLTAIRKIEAREAFETAKKARQVAGQVFNYGIAINACQFNIAGSLAAVMQKQKVSHMAALTTPAELAPLLVAIDGYSGTPNVRNALKLSPMLFQRPIEIRSMDWPELDFETARWSIPGHKMKMENDHIVPLPRQAIEILREQQQLTGAGQYVFPNPRSSKRPMSENGVRTALRTMGFTNDQITPHGFRATARTILDEVLGYRPDWIEHQLAHTVKDSLGRAYNRTSFLPQRAEMLQHWADYLDDLKAMVLEGKEITADFKGRKQKSPPQTS